MCDRNDVTGFRRFPNTPPKVSDASLCVIEAHLLDSQRGAKTQNVEDSGSIVTCSAEEFCPNGRRLFCDKFVYSFTVTVSLKSATLKHDMYEASRSKAICDIVFRDIKN